MKSIVKYSSIAMVMQLSLGTMAVASDATKLNFSDVYQQYQAAAAANNGVDTLTYAQTAYELGLVKFGSDDINCAHLAYNLARALNQQGQWQQAYELLSAQIHAYQKTYGNNGLELIDVYIELGTASVPNHKRQQSYYRKALEIASAHKEQQPGMYAQIQLDVGALLLTVGAEKAKVIIEAQEYLTQHFAANDTKVITANYLAGKYYLSKGKFSQAVTEFERNLAVFAELKGATHPFELQTRAALIFALEKQGNSDAATEHCLAIGAMTPWADTQAQTPLFRVSPLYPMSLLQKGQEGFVELAITVNDMGFVTNPQVLNSQGGKAFERAAIAALSQWRYAPKFEQGVAVDSTTSVRLDFKTSE
ncbi:MAG: TonB family protein [Shewanella sp.]